MLELLHDGNLLEDLELGVAHLVDEGNVRGGGQVALPERVHLFCLSVLALEHLDGLQRIGGARVSVDEHDREQTVAGGRTTRSSFRTSLATHT